MCRHSRYWLLNVELKVKGDKTLTWEQIIKEWDIEVEQELLKDEVIQFCIYNQKAIARLEE